MRGVGRRKRVRLTAIVNTALRVGGGVHGRCPFAIESRGIMIIQSGIRKIKRQNINLNSQTLHNCDTAYYVLSGAPDNTYSFGVKAASVRSSSGARLSSRRFSSASPVETICTTGAQPSAMSRRIASISDPALKPWSKCEKNRCFVLSKAESAADFAAPAAAAASLPVSPPPVMPVASSAACRLV